MLASSSDIASIKPSITTLPNEILDMIAATLLKSYDHLHLHYAKRDLGHLRLVNKAFRDASAKPFATFFEHRSHVVLERSLKTLVEISEHPVFGPSIKTVTLGTAVVPRQQVTLANRPISGRSSPIPSAEHNVLGEANSIFDFVDRFREYESFVNSTQPQELLDRVFEKLHSYGTCVTIGVYDDGLSTGYGSKDYLDLKRLGDEAFRMAYHYPTSEPIPGLRTGHRLEILRSAADGSQCSLNGFSLNFDMHGWADAWDDVPIRSEEKGLDTALAKLLTTSDGFTKQDIDFELQFYNVGYKYLEDGSVRFVAAGRQLELENIHFGERIDPHVYFDVRSLNILALHLQSAKLRSLKIRNCGLEADSLCSFLANHEQSLTELTFDDVLVVTGENEEYGDISGYRALSSWIRTHLSLEYVGIKYVKPYIEDHHDLDGMRCYANGRENVQAALGKHLEMLLHVELFVVPTLDPEDFWENQG